jgi:phenylacetate-CoA ligase
MRLPAYLRKVVGTRAREAGDPLPERVLYPHLLGLVTPLLIEPAIHAPYLSVAHWLRDFSSWPQASRSAYQQACLRAVLAWSAQHVPFYRERLGPAAGDAELSDLPVVDKERIRGSLDRFRAAGWTRMPYVAKHTGGTTYGEPWHYPLDRRAWAHIYGAALHFYERVGYRYGERVVLLGSPTSLGELDSRTARVRNALERRVTTLAGVEVDHEVSLERARGACARHAALWYGYAGTIAAMAQAVLAEGLSLPGPRAIVTTAEALRPEWQRRIEEAFGTSVFDQYGCNDGGIMSQTCRRGRFHLAENVSIVEVLDEDGRACPPGTEGEVVVTNLHARVLPFLRYRVGDRAVLGAGRCPCGEPGLTLERVSGRQMEIIRLPDGTLLSGLPIGVPFEASETVRRWQIVQCDPTHLRVRLDVAPGYGEEEEKRLVSELDALCRHQLDITVTTSEPIRFTPGGKHPMVIHGG